jgi:hypothetical protein
MAVDHLPWILENDPLVQINLAPQKNRKVSLSISERRRKRMELSHHQKNPIWNLQQALPSVSNPGHS